MKLALGHFWPRELMPRYRPPSIHQIHGFDADIYFWLLVTGTWMDYDFPETVGNFHPSQLLLTHSTPSFFQRGRKKPPTRLVLWHFAWWRIVWIPDFHGEFINFRCLNPPFLLIKFTFLMINQYFCSFFSWKIWRFEGSGLNKLKFHHETHIKPTLKSETSHKHRIKDHINITLKIT